MQTSIYQTNQKERENTCWETSEGSRVGGKNGAVFRAKIAEHIILNNHMPPSESVGLVKHLTDIKKLVHRREEFDYIRDT